MKQTIATGHSKLITIIAWFFLIGAIVVLLSIPFGSEVSTLNETFGMPNISEVVVKFGIGVLFIPLAYLYLKRTRVGYWAMVVYATIFSCISASLLTNTGEQIYAGNMLFSLFVLTVTVIQRKEFILVFSDLKK